MRHRGRNAGRERKPVDAPRDRWASYAGAANNSPHAGQMSRASGGAAAAAWISGMTRAGRVERRGGIL